LIFIFDGLRLGAFSNAVKMHQKLSWVSDNRTAYQSGWLLHNTI